MLGYAITQMTWDSSTPRRGGRRCRPDRGCARGVSGPGRCQRRACLGWKSSPTLAAATRPMRTGGRWAGPCEHRGHSLDRPI